MSNQSITQSVRPLCFGDYVGQAQAKAVLNILCKSAQKKGTAIPHILVSGRAGLGKTTLARLVANEMGSKLIEIVAGSINDPQQLTSQLAQLEANDILFIDEIHSLPRSVEEILYSAMEDHSITIVAESDYGDMMKAIGMSSSKQARTIKVDLPPFTLIGATT